MLCLTCKNPFAAQIVLGQKPAEYREWRTSYRGPLLIHSSHRPDASVATSPRRYPYVWHGFILGAVQVVSCVEQQDGQFAFGLASPILFQEPVRHGGNKGLFDVPLSLITAANPPDTLGWLADCRDGEHECSRTSRRAATT